MLSVMTELWAKYTVTVSKHRCGQTFSTYFRGWEGRSPVRRGCKFFFDDFLWIFEKISWSCKTEFLEIQDFQKQAFPCFLFWVFPSRLSSVMDSESESPGRYLKSHAFCLTQVQFQFRIFTLNLQNRGKTKN